MFFEHQDRLAISSAARRISELSSPGYNPLGQVPISNRVMAAVKRIGRFMSR
jgi:hypothetical protein